MRVGDLLMLRIQILAHCRNMRAFRTAAVSRPGDDGIAGLNAMRRKSTSQLALLLLSEKVSYIKPHN